MPKAVMTAILAGMLCVGGGKLLFTVVATLLFSLSPSVRIIDSLLFGASKLTLVGWVPYLLWGGLAGWSIHSLKTSTTKWGALLFCLLILWFHELLWSKGRGYQVSFDLPKLSLLLNGTFWKEAWIVVLVWMAVMIPSFLYLALNFSRVQALVLRLIDRR